MSSPQDRVLRRVEVGGLPLVHEILRRLGLHELLAEYLPPSGREALSAVDVLVLLVLNLAVAKDPLYELARWIEGLDLRPLGFPRRPGARVTDDRCARALDKLYWADRASLQTRLVVAAIRVFGIDLQRLHNDSTSVKACGRIAGKTRTGLELRRGYSKDHRPDLKQLIYTLTISADGAVPIHHHVYPGNRNDETTHIETWEYLRDLHGGARFLYVADCKLCTHPQLSHIVAAGGRVLTIVPQGYREAKSFLDALRRGPLPKKPVWRRPKPGEPTTTEYFSAFEGDYAFDRGGYPIFWFVSSEKRKRDRHSRQQRLLKAEQALAELALKLNTPRLRRKASIKKALEKILKPCQVDAFLRVRIRTHIERRRLRRRGRPPKERPRYRIRQNVSYSLEWSRDREALQRERRADGVFPLLCNDSSLSPRQILQAWKYQPRLEKRFEQFKHLHRAAPLLFKRIERVEANMFLFFVALMAQALLERHVRHALSARKAPPLKLYPEDRDAPHVTTSQILKTFSGLSSYTISEEGLPVEAFQDRLELVHHRVLDLIGLDEPRFWGQR